MFKTLFITDSGCDIPAGLEKTYGIKIIPFSVLIDDKEYLEREELTPQKFYRLADASSSIPKTSQILSQTFYDIFKTCHPYTDVIVPLINSTGSATFRNAQVAAENLKFDGLCKNTNFHIIDSRGYSLVYGYAIIEAAKKIIAGKSVRETVSYLEDYFASAEIYLLAYDLKFMKKSGRINAASAFLGEMMGLKPIISLIDGVSKVEKKCRGEKNLLDEGVKYIAGRAVPETPWCVVRTAISEQENAFIKAFSKAVKCPPAMESQIGCVVGANTGTRAIGVIVKGKKRA